MDNPPEAGARALDRKEVLDAIDSEIKHRESMLSRHGISTWGVIAATVALLWAASNEALSTNHHWTNVLLVLLAGNFGLGFVVSPWLNALGIWNPKGNSSRSFKELILRIGLDADSIPYYFAHATLLLIVAIYVGLKGFLLLSITASALYIVFLLFLGFCWVVCEIQVPLTSLEGPRKPGTNFRLAILSRLLTFVATLVPLDALRTVWPIDASDTRLGLMLAALLFLWGLSIFIIRPPTATNFLRDLRSRLAFGLVEVETANAEAQCILLGSPEEHYLTSKADEIAYEVKKYIRVCNSLCEQIDRIISLSDKLREKTPDQVLLRETTSEFRPMHKNMMTDMKAMTQHVNEATRLRVELLLRVEVAKVSLRIKPEIRNSIVKKVDDLWKEANAARQKFADRGDQFKVASTFLYESQKDVKLPRTLNLSRAGFISHIL